MFYFYHRYFYIQYNYYSKNYLFYWFIKIFFFVIKSFLIFLTILFLVALFCFFSLRRFLRSFFNYRVTYFFFNCRIFLSSLALVSSISFFTLKRFLTCLIMLFYFFWLFQACNFSLLYLVKKNDQLFLKKNECLNVIWVVISNTEILWNM